MGKGPNLTKQYYDFDTTKTKQFPKDLTIKAFDKIDSNSKLQKKAIPMERHKYKAKMKAEEVWIAHH